MKNVSTKLGLAVAAAIGLAPVSAFAHHPTGGQLPNTIMNGLLSGVGHPILGLDHLAFVVGIGILAALIGLGLTLPILFVGFMCVGLVIHLASFTIPHAELLIALSVVLVGAAVVLNRAGGAKWLQGGLFGQSPGTVHGYAFAESIIGAEQGVLGAYVAGLVATQIVIASAAYLIARAIASQNVSSSAAAPRLAGLAIMLDRRLLRGSEHWPARLTLA